MSRISRQAYADMFGPTTGDRVRLADTELWVHVEQDYTIYGEEVKFGGGKVIRDGMGQGQQMAKDVADTVITNALIVDAVQGIVKADIGLKAGRIWRLGKAGNPDVQPGVTIPIGAGTEIIAGEGLAQITDATAIERICREVVEKHPENVAKYRAGNEGVFKFFIGQVMRATRGQANPQQVSDTLRRLLGKPASS